ncbi:hypothetical protein ABT203_35210 [Streptomyces sp900105245]|uniref:hypothetical protein n=1 Tax=Streptomyces sp. 900105245 TaxID=3154379 RepID=UPI0033183A74
MSVLRRLGVRGLVALALSLCALSCANATGHTVPGAVCGTRIDPALTRALLPSTKDLHEFTRVDRTAAITAPCVLLSGREPALQFRFSWDGTSPDLMYLAADNGTVSRVNQPQKAAFAPMAITGTDGAIATTPCKTRGGRYFTLTLQLPQVRLGDRGRRADIEAFMRAYFPATVATLGCGT